MPGGPPPDNPTEETAKELMAVARDLAHLTEKRIELILRALEEGGSTRRIGVLTGTNESFVRRVLAKHGSDELRAAVQARSARVRERSDYWPFSSKKEWDAFMGRRR